MATAAHPQRDADESEQVVVREPAAEAAAVKNPFPTTMVVPSVDGEQLVVELAVVEGVLYAPMIDHLPIDALVRQYITQYCAAWSSSVLVAGKLEASWPAPPRRAQILVPESQLHAMLGLADDERLLRVAYDDVHAALRFIVESPRLPRQPYWDGGPPPISLPVAASYEQPGVVQ